MRLTRSTVEQMERRGYRQITEPHEDETYHFRWAIWMEEQGNEWALASKGKAWVLMARRIGEEEKTD